MGQWVEIFTVLAATPLHHRCRSRLPRVGALRVGNGPLTLAAVLLVMLQMLGGGVAVKCIGGFCSFA